MEQLIIWESKLRKYCNKIAVSFLPKFAMMARTMHNIEPIPLEQLNFILRRNHRIES